MRFSNKRNPILPIDIHIPDSEAHVMANGKLYIYGSYDDRNDMFCSEKYHVVSSLDMNEWTIHDIAFEGKDVPWFNNPNVKKYPGVDWSHPTPFIRKMMENNDMKAEKEKFEQKADTPNPPLLFAPDCIYKNGLYYLYFCMPDESEGVAISNSPTGPFKNPVQLPCGGIDPAIFRDDDGVTYYYWGQLLSHGVKMNEDMISFDESRIVHDIVTEEEHFFHEGSSMRKIGDIYYMVYANIERGKPTSLGYSTSKSPLGPFAYRGIIIDNDGCDPASWNNHGSIEMFNGQWFVFYHRCSLGVKENRRLCIEPIEIRKDGSIPEVKMTSQGIGEPFGTNEKIFAYQACELRGEVRCELDGQGSEWLGKIMPNDTALFRYVYSLSGFREIYIESQGSGEIEILLDNQLVGKCAISITGTTHCPLKVYFIGRKQELKIRFLEAQDLKLISLELY